MSRPFSMRTVAVVTLLLIAGCGTTQTQPATSGTELRGQTYVSDKLSLQFTDDGRLVANAGCNTLSGPVALDSGRLTVTSPNMTEMACDPPRQEQDAWLTRVFDDRPTWSLDGKTLRLKSPNTDIVLTASQGRALTGTRWEAGPASLVFDEKQVAIATGCNTGSAQYQVTGSTIRFDNVATTRRGCPPEQMTPEQQLLALLNGEVNFKIAGDILELVHPSGQNLSLRAK